MEKSISGNLSAERLTVSKRLLSYPHSNRLNHSFPKISKKNEKQFFYFLGMKEITEFSLTSAPLT